MVLVYLRRAVRVVDCTRYLGLPTKVACLLLCLLTTALNVFTFYFLPDGVYYIFMIIAGCCGLVGLIATMTRLRIATTLYIISQTLLLIPLFIVMGYVGYIASDQDCNPYKNKCWYYTDYECDLCLYYSQGFLWTGFTASIFAVIFVSLSLPGMRKLRILQAGNSTYNQPVRGGHIHTVQQSPVFIQQQQPTVTTTYTTYPTVVNPTVVSSNTVYPTVVNPTVVSSNAMYQMPNQPPPYQEAQSVYPNIAPSTYNPATNPTYPR